MLKNVDAPALPGIRIEHFDGLNRTPALRLAARAWHELLEVDLCQEVTLVGWDNQAIVAFEGDKPIGLITWCHTGWLRQIDVMIGYVLPSHRRKGVYTSMWSALVEKARELKAASIESSTRTHNPTMRAAAAAQGRQEVGVILSYDLRGDE